MSHSKYTKRGYSLYIENWNRSAKKYINTCMICGQKGYSPVIEHKDSFSPVRRQIAAMAIEYLIQDGRIHPAKIEEIVHKCEMELEEQMKEAGESAVFDAGVHGLAPELVRMLGSLKFRTSYSQNVLQHSLEVSFIAGMLASELGINVKLAKRAGLLHDIGKAIDHEVEGTHAIIGGELAKKYGEDPEVVEAIMAHHGDIPIEKPLSFIVQAADSISGSRPGARKEILENYIKRLEELEMIAMESKGVLKAFAIQAGREARFSTILFASSRSLPAAPPSSRV